MTQVRVGLETQAHQQETGISGVTRVVREAHVGLERELGPLGIELVPVHTRPNSGGAVPAGHPYLADDPVLSRAVRQVEDVDALLILGLNMTTDFGRVLRARRDRDLRVVTLIHDVMPLVRPDWFMPQARLHYRAYVQQALRVSDHVVVTSEAVRAGLLGLGWAIPGQVHVIRLGSPFSQRPPSPAPERPLGVLYVSTVAPRKGHDLLIDAFDIVRARGVDVNLTLVGREGWLIEKTVRAIVSHPEFGTTLHWLRTASDADIADAAGACRVAVVPAEEEGYGMFLEEGLTLGLSTVARDIPVFRERRYPNLSFTQGTPAAFADAIVAAGAATPAALAPGTVRSMADFTSELADLVRSALP